MSDNYDKVETIEDLRDSLARMLADVNRFEHAGTYIDGYLVEMPAGHVTRIEPNGRVHCGTLPNALIGSLEWATRRAELITDGNGAHGKAVYIVDAIKAERVKLGDLIAVANEALSRPAK